MNALPEPQTVWAFTPTSNPRKGIKGTLALERGNVTFTPEGSGVSPGLRLGGGAVVAAAKAPRTPILELQLAFSPGEMLLYFAEPSFFFDDWHDLYKMAFADVLLDDIVQEWRSAILHPPPERVSPDWTLGQEERLKELEAIREERGLTDEEANELVTSTRSGKVRSTATSRTFGTRIGTGWRATCPGRMSPNRPMALCGMAARRRSARTTGRRSSLAGHSPGG
jgi:hypothetical protein